MLREKCPRRLCSGCGNGRREEGDPVLQTRGDSPVFSSLHHVLRDVNARYPTSVFLGEVKRVTARTTANIQNMAVLVDTTSLGQKVLTRGSPDVEERHLQVSHEIIVAQLLDLSDR